MRFEPDGAEDRELVARQVAVLEDAVTDRVVDVVVDVRDAVDDADDPALEALGLLLAGVREDAVSHLVRQVHPLGDPQRLLVVAEAPAEALRERGVECLLAGVPERRVAGVVAEADRLDEILVQPERAGDDAGDPGRLERVGHPGAVVVARRVDEHLRLALEAPERLGVDDPVAVALEGRPHVGLLFGSEPAACLVRAHCERGEGAPPPGGSARRIRPAGRRKGHKLRDRRPAVATSSTSGRTGGRSSGRRCRDLEARDHGLERAGCEVVGALTARDRGWVGCSACGARRAPRAGSRSRSRSAWARSCSSGSRRSDGASSR